MRGWPNAMAATNKGSGGTSRRPRHDDRTKAKQKGSIMWLHSFVHNTEHVVGMPEMQLQRGIYGCQCDRGDKQQAQHDGWQHRHDHRRRPWTQDMFMHLKEHSEGKEGGRLCGSPWARG
jgi:hypothetical protein